MTRRHIDRGPQHCAVHSAGVHCDGDCPGRLHPASPAPSDAPYTYFAPLAPPASPFYLAHESTLRFDTGLPGNVPITGIVRYAGMDLAAVRGPDEPSEDRTHLEVAPDDGDDQGDDDAPSVGAETVEEMDDAVDAFEREREQDSTHEREHE